MNNTLLWLLYHGKVYPAVDVGRHPCAEERRRGHNIEEEMDYFEKALSHEDWARFSKLDGLQRDSNYECSFENFRLGFRLGTMLMVEAMANGQEMLQE